MEHTINFGIDLGTTNSSIAKFTKGNIEIFNNPRDYGRNTLPSIVAFKKDKIIVGSKAKERLERDSKNVVSVFKRKMGTSETYPIKSIKQSKNPIELSALVLKELKTFVPDSTTLDSIVITIPASFDTIQSNATKESGLQAGFKQVVLLQEPIAASLAYANKVKEKELSDGKWLVYDLGGGTFDVALIKISNGEMKVLDHEGDNFLGGSDFDRMIVENFIIPHLESEGCFSDLKKEMQSASGKYNSSYYICLNKAEQAKIELSARTSTEIELIIDDDDGEEIDTVLTITRTDFEDMIKTDIDTTVDMVKKIITKNSILPEELQFTLMVGGSTYIPFVKQRVGEIIGSPINTDIDPTTAVAVGAAHFAGTKEKNAPAEQLQDTNVKIHVKMAYEKTSKESEEFFAAKVTGELEDVFYRIDRNDGGFSTGLKKIRPQISEDLPLVPNTFNFFTLTVYDTENNIIKTNAEMIGINSGYAVSGQPLPHDICIEIDDYENPGKTKLELVFSKNDILPARKSFTKTLDKSVANGSDEKIIINILEGPMDALPASNQTIGFMQIKGTALERDVSKGSDIEISIEITESRDVIVSVYLTMLDQEFKEVFNPKARHTPIDWLVSESETLSNTLNEEISHAQELNDLETVSELNKLSKDVDELLDETSELATDDVTDKKFQFENKKREIAQKIDQATKEKIIQQAKSEYDEIKNRCLMIVDEHGDEYEQKAFDDIINQENVFLTNGNHIKIREKIDEMEDIYYQIQWRVPEFLISIYKYLAQKNSNEAKSESKFESLKDSGLFAINSENWERLAEIDRSLFSLFPQTNISEIAPTIGF